MPDRLRRRLCGEDRLTLICVYVGSLFIFYSFGLQGSGLLPFDTWQLQAAILKVILYLLSSSLIHNYGPLVTNGSNLSGSPFCGCFPA